MKFKYCISGWMNGEDKLFKISNYLLKFCMYSVNFSGVSFFCVILSSFTEYKIKGDFVLWFIGV